MAGPLMTNMQMDEGSGDVPPNVPDINATPAELDVETATLLALVLALKGIDTNLQQAYDEYMKPTRNMAKFIALVKASKLFQDYGKLARQRAMAKVEQPGVWKQELDEYKTQQKKRIIGSLGPKAWNPEVEKQVEYAFEFGLADDVLDKLIIETGKIGAPGGAGLASIEDLQQFANSYGVGNQFNQKYWDDQNQRLFLGETTAADIQNEIKDRAINTYPAFAEGFKAGKSLDIQGAWIKSVVGNTVGIDPNTLTWDNPLVSKWLGWVDPKTNQQTVPPTYLVQRTTRSENFDAFARTPEGTAYLDGLSLKVLQDMGLM